MAYGPFDLRAISAEAKRQIDDALRVRPIQPPPQQPQPVQGQVTLVPGGAQIGGSANVGPGTATGSVGVGMPQPGQPGGFGVQNAQMGYAMPVGRQGQAQVNAQMQPGPNGLQLAQLAAQYAPSPNTNYGVSYSPGLEQLMATYRKRFQEGGLATSIHLNPSDRERDIEFLNTRNMRLREVAGLQPFDDGGYVV